MLPLYHFDETISSTKSEYWIGKIIPDCMYQLLSLSAQERVGNS